MRERAPEKAAKIRSTHRPCKTLKQLRLFAQQKLPKPFAFRTLRFARTGRRCRTQVLRVKGAA